MKGLSQPILILLEDDDVVMEVRADDGTRVKMTMSPTSARETATALISAADLLAPAARPS